MNPSDTLKNVHNPDLIIPICVYHIIESDKFLCYINSSQNMLDENGNQVVECIKPPIENPYGNAWHLAFYFYSVNPLFRPVPVGMQLYCAIRNPEYPYNTIQIKKISDSWPNLDLDGTYFYAYNKPVPETKPLYIYEKDHKEIFVNYCAEPPPCLETTYKPSPNKIEHLKSSVKAYKDPADPYVFPDSWVDADISPIFVMKMEDFPKEDPSEIKFICNNGIVMPWNGPLGDSVYNVSNQKPEIFYEAVVDCNELVPDNQGGGAPFSLINLIKQQSLNTPSTQPKNTPSTSPKGLQSLTFNTNPQSNIKYGVTLILYIISYILIIFSF